jgi:hypothetical protein
MALSVLVSFLETEPTQCAWREGPRGEEGERERSSLRDLAHVVRKAGKSSWEGSMLQS